MPVKTSPACTRRVRPNWHREPTRKRAKSLYFWRKLPLATDNRSETRSDSPYVLGMKEFRTHRRVPFTPEQMFRLVADVDRYPEFLPLCEGMRVRSRRQSEAETILIADMTMGYKAIRETISSRVTLDPGTPRVDVAYLSGPFSQMRNEWRFEPTREGCIVHFYIGYKVRNPLLGFMVQQLFDKAFSRFASAFEARAHQIYGGRGQGGFAAPMPQEV